jgi:hypothetical protein
MPYWKPFAFNEGDTARESEGETADNRPLRDVDRGLELRVTARQHVGGQVLDVDVRRHAVTLDQPLGAVERVGAELRRV